jgi:hypothetical protein
MSVILYNIESVKVEQVIHQNNELRDVVDDIQFDVSAIKSQASRLDPAYLLKIVC